MRKLLQLFFTCGEKYCARRWWEILSNKQTADSRQQTADSRQQTADSRQQKQTTDNRQQTTDSRQQTTDSRQQTVDSRQQKQTTDNRQQTTDSRQQTADNRNRQQTTDNRQQTTDNRQQTTNKHNTQHTANNKQTTNKQQTLENHPWWTEPFFPCRNAVPRPNPWGVEGTSRKRHLQTERWSVLPQRPVTHRNHWEFRFAVWHWERLRQPSEGVLRRPGDWQLHVLFVRVAEWGTVAE